MLSGGFATAIHYFVMASLIATELDATIATAVGAGFGALINYGLQHRWAFHSRRRHTQAAPTYLFVCSTSWVINVLLFYAIHNLLHIAIILAQLVTTGLLTLLNYFLYRKMVFI